MFFLALPFEQVIGVWLFVLSEPGGAYPACSGALRFVLFLSFFVSTGADGSVDGWIGRLERISMVRSKVAHLAEP